MSKVDPFAAKSTFQRADGTSAVYYRLKALEEAGLTNLAVLPFSIRVLLEAALRNCDDFLIRKEDIENIAR